MTLSGTNILTFKFFNHYIIIMLSSISYLNFGIVKEI